MSVDAIFPYGLFFGIYLITVAFANRWLVFVDEGWRFRKNIHWFMFAITNLIFAVETADVGIAVSAIIAEAHFVEEGHRPSEYTEPPWIAIATCALANTIALLTDIVLMYRLWMVFAKQMWIIWFPIFLWLGGIVCAVLQTFLQIVHIHNPDLGPYHWASIKMTIGPGIVLIPFWVSTIMLNAYCTVILIWRVWRASKEGENGTAAKQLRFTVRILMESGFLYLSISFIHFFVWFGHDDKAIHMLGEINAIVIGIAFNLLIIRAAQKRAEDKLVTRSPNLMPWIPVVYTTSVETDLPTLYQANGSHRKETVWAQGTELPTSRISTAAQRDE